MLGWAGGEDRNAQDGKDSVRIPWEDVVAGEPEVVRACFDPLSTLLYVPFVS